MTITAACKPRRRPLFRQKGEVIRKIRPQTRPENGLKWRLLRYAGALAIYIFLSGTLLRFSSSASSLSSTEVHDLSPKRQHTTPLLFNLSYKPSNVALDHQLNCTSPEYHIEWPVQGSIISRTSNNTCGLDGSSSISTFLRNVRDKLQHRTAECSDLVVYGVAFGNPHFRNLNTRYTRQFLDPARLLKANGHCFFVFVLEDHMPKNQTSFAALNHLQLIGVPRRVLPYSSLRRNTKLLKYMGHFLFQSDRILWQDAKFFQRIYVHKLPKNYSEVVSPLTSCVTTMSLPVHPNTFGRDNIQKSLDSRVSYQPSFLDHCTTIIESLGKRPGVTDSGDILMEQCKEFMRQASNPSLMDRALIDSAFIIWDQRSQFCRDFNAALQCTLLDLLHCHADRDQVSWPFAVDIMGLQATEDKDTRTQDTTLRLNSENPVVRITKSSCHWYFTQLGECKDRPRVAILQAGTAKRFHLGNTVDHLLSKQPGFSVDYYAHFSMESGKSYRQTGYMERLQLDPLIMQTIRRRGKKNSRKDIVRETLRSEIEKTSSQLITSVVDRWPTSVPSTSKLNATKRLLEAQSKDPRTNFPMMDNREGAKQRTIAGNENLLRLAHNLQTIWDTNVVLQEAMYGKNYDYVMILRDDTLWIEDFDLNALIATNTKADAYVLSCDARRPPMLDVEVNDHGIVLKRDKAQVLTRYFTSLLTADWAGCHASVTGILGRERGCNSEMLLKWILDHNEMVIERVPQSLFPFQRSVSVRTKGRTQTCFHKFCQSQHQPLQIPSNLKSCKDLNL